MLADDFFLTQTVSLKFYLFYHLAEQFVPLSEFELFNIICLVRVCGSCTPSSKKSAFVNFFKFDIKDNLFSSEHIMSLGSLASAV